MVDKFSEGTLLVVRAGGRGGLMSAIIGGWAGALLFEQSGSWAVGFYGSAVMALIAAGMAVGLRASNLTAKARAANLAPAIGVRS